MLRILRDQIWQFVGAVLALIAIFTAYNIFFMERPSKQLNVTVISNNALVTVQPEVASDIEVRYRGREAKSIALIQVRIENTGNRPIVESDYSRPVLFSFNPAAEIVDVAIVESKPPNIGMSISKISVHQAQASPVLLNPDDSVDARFILVADERIDDLGEFEVEGRIVGVKQIDLMDSAESPSRSLFESLDFLFALLGVLAGILARALQPWREKLSENLRRKSKGMGKEKVR